MAQLGGCSSEGDFGSVNDAVCTTVELSDTGVAPITIWADTTSYIINGTILIENNGIIGASPTASLLVNGTPVADFTVAAGEARSLTVDNINLIQLAGVGAGTARVKVSFSLNYQF
ncbi:S-Ena type endospore appendage [Priestia aryabhattai]|uniref:DUF3992 domain-containing protein n=1 Tax=Priestia aryabhattai TaxID=412384 RepID=UPI003D2B2B82